jgi:starch phosphorylase
MLSVLGHKQIERFHMNEGHASLLTLELLERLARGKKDTIGHEEIDLVRRKCVFTTHTPIPAGHDQFPLDLVKRVIGKHVFERPELKEIFCCGDVLNMTYLALNLSHYVNGVAKRHGEISRSMFPRYPIDSITNGVHCATWASGPFQRLFDRHIPGWREDNFSLRYAIQIPSAEVWSAHRQAKHALLERVNRETNAGMDQDVLTLGFARRFTAYKRPDLIFQDLEELKKLARQVGPLQIVYAGKAHPRDEWGKDLIRQAIQAGRNLRGDIRFAFLENHDLSIAQLLCAGVDVWLNTPQPPLEASGTSGMKAAVNGVPSLSIADGWWLEGRIEGVTGWTIGADGRLEASSVAAGGVAQVAVPGDTPGDAQALYRKLRDVAALFYGDHERFMDVMRHAIAINASFFNTQRMMQQYVLKAYFS